MVVYHTVTHKVIASFLLERRSKYGRRRRAARKNRTRRMSTTTSVTKSRSYTLADVLNNEEARDKFRGESIKLQFLRLSAPFTDASLCQSTEAKPGENSNSASNCCSDTNLINSCEVKMQDPYLSRCTDDKIHHWQLPHCTVVNHIHHII